MTVEVDLHVHTTASDGTLTPRQLLEEAARRGLKAVGITDHDTTSGLAEATKAAQAVGVEIVPGIELSTVWHDQEVHVLGYWLEYEQNWFQVVLQDLRQERVRRIEKIVKQLNNLGYHISLERVKEVAGGGAMGRPHVARVLMENGFVNNTGEAFRRLLAKGAPAYVPRQKLTPAESVRLIRRAKGVPVLAHPGLIGNENIVEELLIEGLEGIEVYYPEHSAKEQARFLELAERWHLVATGGSDFHGSDRASVGDLGSFGISCATLIKLKKVKDIISASAFGI
ncbi:hypothetical protein SY88_00645 [Clostridiales bacterium PH28_bin88]|nr:hypothetical protein SY88_00645 [Clostridiales bacterium PH28_bin88]